MKSTMISKLASKLTSNKRSKASPTSSAVQNASDSDNGNERYAQFDNRSGFVQFGTVRAENGIFWCKIAGIFP